MRRSTATTCCLLLAGTFIGLLAPRPLLRAAPAAAQPKSLELQKSILETASAARETSEKMYRQGLTGFDEVLTWSLHELDAKLALAASKAERIELLEEHVKHSQERARLAEQRVQAGLASPLESHAARYLRLESELRLAKAREE